MYYETGISTAVWKEVGFEVLTALLLKVHIIWDGYYVALFSKQFAVIVPSSSRPVFLEFLDPDDEGTMIL
jgi:hypothetical protein